MSEEAAGMGRIAAWKTEVLDFLRAHVDRFGEAARADLDFDADLAAGRAWQATKAENGFAGITWPKEYGGAGRSEIEKIIFAEEESRLGFPVRYFQISLGMPIPIMLAYATEKQKLRYAPPAIRGEEIWCQLFSEPAAGSDLAALRLSARQDGDNWVLNGQKLWTSWAQIADFGVLVARNDPSVAKHRGLTYFFADMRAPGVTVKPITKLTGESEINEVFFDDVVIPDANRLGPIGGGFKVALDTLMIERFAVSDPAGNGPPVGCFVSLAASIPCGEGMALDDGEVRAEIAEAYAEQLGLGMIHAQAMAMIAAGKEPGPEGSIRKLLTALRRQRLGRAAMDMIGPESVVLPPDAPTQKNFTASWLDAPCFRIAGGTDEILRNTIAERILGLPQDYRPDKGVPFKNL
jgi:alkylation response protein AidB-like acyl-CoA dehydrogenase